MTATLVVALFALAVACGAVWMVLSLREWVDHQGRTLSDHGQALQDVRAELVEAQLALAALAKRRHK